MQSEAGERALHRRGAKDAKVAQRFSLLMNGVDSLQKRRPATDHCLIDRTLFLE